MSSTTNISISKVSFEARNELFWYGGANYVLTLE